MPHYDTLSNTLSVAFPELPDSRGNGGSSLPMNLYFPSTSSQLPPNPGSRGLAGPREADMVTYTGPSYGDIQSPSPTKERDGDEG